MKRMVILPRKKPRQQRSNQMMDDILQGAIRVLKQQGGRRFTTIRVAEEAGISVGSLYQYFPNKESILFRVQHQEWLTTSQMILGMIADTRYSPTERLKRAIRAFFQLEVEEADLRRALAETGVIMDDTEQFQKLRAEIFSKMSDFIAELLPEARILQRKFIAKFIFTTIASLAEKITSQPESGVEIKQWSETCSDMILSFLDRESR